MPVWRAFVAPAFGLIGLAGVFDLVLLNLPDLVGGSTPSQVSCACSSQCSRSVPASRRGGRRSRWNPLPRRERPHLMPVQAIAYCESAAADVSRSTQISRAVRLGVRLGPRQ